MRLDLQQSCSLPHTTCVSESLRTSTKRDGSNKIPPILCSPLLRNKWNMKIRFISNMAIEIDLSGNRSQCDSLLNKPLSWEACKCLSPFLSECTLLIKKFTLSQNIKTSTCEPEQIVSWYILHSLSKKSSSWGMSLYHLLSWSISSVKTKTTKKIWPGL